MLQKEVRLYTCLSEKDPTSHLGVGGRDRRCLNEVLQFMAVFYLLIFLLCRYVGVAINIPVKVEVISLVVLVFPHLNKIPRKNGSNLCIL